MNDDSALTTVFVDRKATKRRLRKSRLVVEEGPEKGLFTGSQGEWVIVGPKTEETDAEEKKRPQKPVDDAQ